jgi:hypothetical protein
MIQKSLGVCIALGVTISLAVAAETPRSSQSQLSAAEIVSKNVSARGGLQAWRAVQTLSFTGKLGAGGNQRATLAVPAPVPSGPVTGRKAYQLPVPPRPVDEVQLPFVMDLERSRKMRIELKFNGQTAIQVYDGANGWKFRPFLNRRVVEPYTPEELKSASLQADLDGHLVDYAAKGTQVQLVGTEMVEGRDAYKLKLTMKSGESMHVWIDAQTFLEVKIEGQPRRLDGTYHAVEIYYRDYQPVDGLQIPRVLETKVLPVPKTTTGLRDTPVPVEKIVIEKVVVNPKLDESLFSKPDSAVASKAR